MYMLKFFFCYVLADSDVKTSLNLSFFSINM